MPENAGGIPKTITVGGVEYVIAEHPELLSLVEAGRKGEKDKLYSQIQGLEASIKVLKDEAKSAGTTSQKDKDALKALQDELAVAKADLEKAGKQDPPKPTDPPKTDPPAQAGLSAEEVTKIVEKALANQAKKHEEDLLSVRGDLSKKTVEDYRKEVLQKNKGLLIEDLVPEGMDSVEAVNKAVERALVTSKDFIRKPYTGADGKVEQLTLAEIEEKEKVTPPAGAPPTPAVYVPAGSPPPPPAGNGNLTGKELVKDLKNMSPEDYEKNRSAIKQEILKIGVHDKE